MAGGPGTLAKVSGLLLGLVFALFASPIITSVQALSKAHHDQALAQKH